MLVENPGGCPLKISREDAARDNLPGRCRHCLHPVGVHVLAAELVGTVGCPPRRAKQSGRPFRALGAVLPTCGVIWDCHEILEGAREVLGRIQVVVLEASFYAVIVGTPQIARQIAYMDMQGFAVYDFINPLYRPMDGAMSQVDIVHVREKGFFRANYAYATPKQRATILALGHH
jgi:hypothetical protein